MLEWITVTALIIVGIGLIIVEVLFVPGTTFVGLLGFLAALFGLYLGFVYFGVDAGIWLTAGGSILLGVSLYFSFKGRTWEKFSLKDTISSKVNEGLTSVLKVGDEGVAVSTLKPIGKAEFTNGLFEVKSLGNYLDSGTKIRIIKISTNNIFVEPIT
ncbi:hypothetical protein LVD15_04605 [Fulvivirga maritima]|uniref:NfeD family protein n=1 Tax=Fulvivirga maritima TaxID=2904247 RepID=UPI001F45A2F6|nr:NfeD family protein [Fulvivirga maritima]UII27709.1 hypothetical protein LVD15_04605 [Fulvivirga maritima]